MEPSATDGLPIPQRYTAIVVVGLGVTMAVLDGAIANIALPTIARELNATPAESVWVVNAYQLIVMVSLLSLSSLGEKIGYSRIYRIGLAIFGVASLACALSDSLTTLTLARVLQGAGAACLMSVNTALIRFIYPRAQLGRGIGINTFIVATAAAAGPTIAAGILSMASWPWIFAVNVPISLLAFAISSSLPRTRRSPHRFDWGSAVLNAITFALLITLIDDAGYGVGNLGRVAAEAIGLVVCGVWLVRRQLSQTSPLLPIDLLRIPIFALSICTSILSFAGQMLAFVALPFYLQNVIGRSEVETGLLMTPWPIVIMVVAPLSGRLADRYHSGLLGAIGMALFAAGLVGLALLPAHPSSLDIIWRMMLCGAGFGLFQSPNNRTLIGSAPIERTGGASGMLGTARLLGQTVGAALVALIFNLYAGQGTRVVLFTAAGFAVAAMVMSSLRLTGAARGNQPS